MANRVIGLDLGQHNIALIELEVGFRSWELAGATIIPLPELEELDDEGAQPNGDQHDASTQPSAIDADGGSAESEAIDPDSQREAERQAKRLAAELYARRVKAALAPLVEDGRLSVDSINIQLAAREAYLETIELPFNQRRQIQPILIPQLDGRFPVDVSELHLDFTVGAQRGDQYQIFTAGVESELMRERLEMLSEAGIDPKIIDLGPFPLAVAYNAFYQDQPETAAIVDIGAESTNIIVLRHGAPDYIRTFINGGEDLTRALAECYDLPLERARAGKHSEGFIEAADSERDLSAEEAEIASTLQKAAMPLLRQLRRSLSAHASQAEAPAERIYLVGATARLPGLAEWISSSLNVEVIVPGPGKNVPLWDQVGEHAPQLMSALGLALRDSSQSKGSEINLRHGDFSFSGGYLWLVERLPALGGWTAAIVALLLLLLLGNILQIRAESKALDDALEQATTQLFGAPLLVPDRIISRLRQPAQGQDFLPNQTAWDVFKNVAAQVGDMQDDGYTLEARTIEVDMQRRLVDINGSASSAESVEELEARLQLKPCLRNVSRSSLSRSRDSDGFIFHLNAIASCSPAGDDL